MEGYFGRLRKQTNDIDAYLRWSTSQIEPSTPSMDAAELLRTLQTVNLRDTTASVKLSDPLDQIKGEYIPLAKDATRKLVVAPDEPALTIGPYRSLMTTKRGINR
jgi:hypothetical protein